jgi:hypothetical protein
MPQLVQRERPARHCRGRLVEQFGRPPIRLQGATTLDTVLADGTAEVAGDLDAVRRLLDTAIAVPAN